MRYPKEFYEYKYIPTVLFWEAVIRMFHSWLNCFTFIKVHTGRGLDCRKASCYGMFWWPEKQSGIWYIVRNVEKSYHEKFNPQLNSEYM